GKKYDGPEVDVWSLGVILYTLVSGSLPFDGQNLKELRERVLRGKYRIPFYMSTDCENLLKRFLVLNPGKRGTLEQIMKDRWISAGSDEEALKPFIEPELDITDQKRIDMMVGMGYSREEIQDSLSRMKYDDITATYLLLGRKAAEVEASDSSSSSSVSLVKPRPSSSSQSPAHLLTQRSSKQRRYSDQVGPVSSVAPHPRRSQTAAGGAGAEGKQEVGGQNRKSSPAGGSPLLGNANNPNMADIPERRKTSATPTVSPAPINILTSFAHIEPERPKTHCEHHRDSVQTTSPEGYPILGAFVPQCDAEGQYAPLQCHSSTGHCWCVDSRGQERAGTRTAPGTPPKDCDKPDEPESPKTHCEQHRDNIQTTSPEGYPIIGAFVPQCDANGQYRPLQCHGSTGHCWCVDNRGQERTGTRTLPGTPPKDCDKPERPKTHCEHHRDRVQTTSPEGYPIVGAFVPQCDAEGQYTPLQCHGSTGHCWCVDSRGQERTGTRTLPGTPPKDCDQPDEPERPKTHCEHHRDSVQTTSPEEYPIGAFVPQCDAEGQYRPLQCHGSTGHCWCVDSRGQERVGTRTLPGTPPKDCDKPVEPERPKTHCEQHRDRVQTTSPEGYPILGVFVPQCDAVGQYTPQQCHGSTGHCWCVDSRGQERTGTRTPPGTPSKDCEKPAEPERPKTHCEHHRDRVQTTSPEGYPIVGAFVPQCDAGGQYTPQQCHGSTGHCWCVDSRGQERTGTRTPPGTPPKDCDKPVPVAPTQRSESVCERWRASLMEHYNGSPEPHHYLPQCEPDGHFSPVQCYGDTSYCWCVDQDGREIPGTRSHDVVKPACIATVAPPTVHPLPRPDVTPPPSDITLLYAQGQKIGALPLNGTKLDPDRSKTLLALHGSIVVGVAYDCKENQVYWTDLSGRTINRASVQPGAEPEILINTDLTSPEGLAVDVSRRLMFWVDSAPDKIERSNLDGSGRRTLFTADLVNPRAIIVVSSTGTLYWTDWNREAPKIESSSVDGHNRRVVVSDGIGLPNALTYDSTSGQVCWADAGTKRLECIFPDGSGRRVIHPNLNYPFSMVYYRNHFYYTDWRRDGVIAVSKDSSQFTDEYLPDQRSHLYGIAIATTHCLSGSH
uniref:uncharacterized protein n=1 Tax=Centroberyx gerrardi TaxID=166262 RepID=UPI003AAE708B